MFPSHDQWITKPIYNPPTVDEKDVNKKASQWKENIRRYAQEVEKYKEDNDKLSELREYGKKLNRRISNMRKDSLQTDGEFGIGNLAFKKLRNDEDIGVLLNTINTAYDYMFNESMNFKQYYQEVY